MERGSGACGPWVIPMTDTQAPGWRHPGQHLARRVEVRTAAEMMNLMTLDALIATYGMDADEMHELMLLVRSLYRGGGQVTRRQALFLHDLSRSLDDLAIDAGALRRSGALVA
jgi:hypothetical protein